LLDFLLEKLKELKSTFEEAITNLEADKEDIKKELEFSRQYCDEYQVRFVYFSKEFHRNKNIFEGHTEFNNKYQFYLKNDTF